MKHVAWTAALLAVGGAGGCGAREPLRVLVFTRTAAFRHESIPAAVEALRGLGRTGGFEIEATEDSASIEPATLARVRAVVFLHTSGDVLDDSHQTALERFVRGGGGFVGVHAAADTEHGWPFYAELVGARFAAHPAIQEAVVRVEDRAHPASEHLPARWTRRDEWYDFDASPRGSVRVLASLESGSYEGSTMGDDHPIVWCRDVGRGRAFYTGLGHVAEAWSDPTFLRHVLGGVLWAAGAGPTSAGTTPTDSGA
jgi:type 1 glutamine amidotransferase